MRYLCINQSSVACKTFCFFNLPSLCCFAGHYILFAFVNFSSLLSFSCFVLVPPGIVAAEVGVRGGRALLSSLRSAAESCGRKVYTFAVGKVNVEKLSNFAAIEAFCLVACAESSLLDARGFHVPVVTPLELLIALGETLSC